MSAIDRAELAALEDQIAHLRAELQDVRDRQDAIPRRNLSRKIAIGAVAVVLAVAIGTASAAVSNMVAVAPFEVADSNGSPIMKVTNDHSIQLFDTGGKPRITLTSTQSGGVVITEGREGTVLLHGDSVQVIGNGGDEANLGAAVGTKTLALRFLRQNKPMVLVGIGNNNAGVVAVKDDAGQQAVTISSAGKDGFLKVFAGDSDVASLGAAEGTKTLALRFQRGTNTLAAMGIGTTNAGVLGVKDSGGDQAVTISSDGKGGYVNVYNSGQEVAAIRSEGDGKGQVNVFNKGGKPVVTLTQSSQGDGGNITVGDPSGNGIMSAGYSPADDGDLCLDRKQHLWCLGINLPLSLSR